MTLPPLSRQHIAIIAGTLLVLLGGILGGYVWARSYAGTFGPNMWIGPIDVSRLSEEEARTLLQERIDRLMTDGIPLRLEGSDARLSLASGGGADVSDDVRFDIDEALRSAQAYSGNDTPSFKRLPKLLGLTVRETQIAVPITFSEERVKERVWSTFPGRGEPPVDAGFFIEGGVITVLPSAKGKEYSWESFFPTLHTRLSTLSQERIDLTLTFAEPNVTTEAAEEMKSLAEQVVLRSPYTISWSDEATGKEGSWEITNEKLNGLLAPSKDGRIVTEPSGFEELVATLSPEIEIEAQNARFSIDGGRVKEFTASRAGRSIDREHLALELEARFAEDGTPSPIIVKTITTEPDITVDEVNDLGITEILGVGTSSYRGSPSNRIKNIRNGVQLLNGLLIAPGEEFSLLKALQPFTLANGYLPELVIKGDKIEPEIGGGLCQIGTTTFRATMNSGLPVTQRRNHSLVVSYYNDPGNGNPGTDATIYDPAPDYRFKNDTGSPVLFQAEMLEDTQALRFTFWGTSDGRKGSYVPPTVLRWIGVGPTINTPTTDLAPGTQRCQEAHVGADTVFTYTIVRPNGTTEETNFESHYRPLPRMCLIGTDPSEMPGATPPPEVDESGNPVLPPEEPPAPPIEEPLPLTE